MLAEGSKLVLVAAHSTAEQGAYGLASNLGSLVVRTLFQPFEEAAYLAFSRSGAAAGGGGGGGSNGAALAVRVRLSRVLAVAVRTVTIVGAIHQEPGASGRAAHGVDAFFVGSPHTRGGTSEDCAAFKGRFIVRCAACLLLMSQRPRVASCLLHICACVTCACNLFQA